MKTFKTLYKKTSTGAIQFWQISVLENPDHSIAYDILTEYGQYGTTSPQRTVDTIFEGKNIGKANETSVKEQAYAEAQSQYEKKLKRGYVEDMGDASKGKRDKIIQGGVDPMLAHKFKDHGHKIKWPAYVQPKLDGIRCIAVIEDGKCTLWTRTRKPITGVPHIVAALEKAFKNKSIVLDGECYNHKFKNDFEKIVHFVRQDEPEAGHETVQYHIYDVVNDQPFSERMKVLAQIPIKDPMMPVQTALCDEEGMMEAFALYRSNGYEGCMVRNANSLYVNKRSYDLLKVKEMQDDEFEIVGIEEGRGKLMGHVGSFICKTKKGETFNVKMAGDTEMLKKYFENHKLWKGKKLTVQFQDLTAYGIPRFPVGKGLRDYE